jgi:hypothetical protein
MRLLILALLASCALLLQSADAQGESHDEGGAIVWPQGGRV